MSVAPAKPEIAPLSRPVTTLFGVGPERAAQLARLEIHTVEDLLLHRPRRYEDRQHLRRIAELQLGEPAITHGRIIALGTKWYKQHTRSIFEFVIEDGTGRLYCRWWNAPYLEKCYSVGNEVLVFGRPLRLKPRTIDHPETEVLEGGEENFIHLNRITPIYSLTEGLSQRWLRSLIWRTLQRWGDQFTDPWPAQHAGLGREGDPKSNRTLPPPSHTLSAALSNQADPNEVPCPQSPFAATSRAEVLRFSRAEAVRRLHFPETEADAQLARRRLALDEFVALQCDLRRRRRNFEAKARALPCAGDNRLLKPFLARLGYKLTAAQTRVLREMRKDLSGPYPMRRLLQGDVGSGKTVVAACCALMALESHYSVALMAPTEILAEQHFLTLSNWLKPLGVPVALWTGSRKEAETLPGASASQTPGLWERPAGSPTNGPANLAAPPGAAPPAASLTIGTHALIEGGFASGNLGLVIIDEQHKFGVAQRERLVRKGAYPHLLVMTATPIPRTLGLTLYGELEVSTIDELPPGRGRVKTFVRSAAALAKVWEFIRGKLSEGRQVYVVYPRVEESGANGVKAVTREYETLSKRVAPFLVGLVHGRLKPREKEQVMAAFRANRVQVLLATSLIEVGVDVPNATIMLIENAEQFGLAQLHQLRGRIGRGAEDSFCILVAAARRGESSQRLQILADTSDGFEIAEADLLLRGPGELLGQQQSGLPRFRFGDLAEDLDLIKLARAIAAQLEVLRD